MLKNLSGSKDLSCIGRNPRAGRLNILIAILLVLGTINSNSVAQAAADHSLTVTRLIIRPQGDITICVGEKVTFTVAVRSRVLEWTTEIATIDQQNIWESGGQIQVNPSSSRVGFMSPGSSNLSVRPGSPNANATFVFSGSRPGAMTMTFHDTGARGRFAAWVNPSITVTVKKCNYQLIVNEEWIATAPFLIPKLHSNYETTLIPNENGRIAPVTTGVYNSGHHTQETPGILKCTHPVTPAIGTATITGNLNVNNGTLDLDLSFGSIKATTEFDCQVAIPLPQAQIGADSEGPGKPLVLDPRPIAVRASAGESTTIMDHVIIAVSTVTGKANIQIIPIYLD